MKITTRTVMKIAELLLEAIAPLSQSDIERILARVRKSDEYKDALAIGFKDVTKGNFFNLVHETHPHGQRHHEVRCRFDSSTGRLRGRRDLVARIALTVINDIAHALAFYENSDVEHRARPIMAALEKHGIKTKSSVDTIEDEDFLVVEWHYEMSSLNLYHLHDDPDALTKIKKKPLTGKLITDTIKDSISSGGIEDMFDSPLNITVNFRSAFATIKLKDSTNESH